MKYILIILSFIICISCSKKNLVVLFDTKVEHSYEEVTIKDLKKNYGKYDGKWLKVTDGFVNIRFEKCVLQPRLNNNPRDYKDIWVWYPNNEYEGFGDIFERINQKKVILKGFFTTKKKGHLSAYPGSLESITYIAVYE